MKSDPVRSDLKRARGLGSASTGTSHWWQQRVTAVALIPLTLWFVASFLSIAGRSHEVFVAWLRSPFVAVLMILFLIALFHHIALGLQVVIEDYVHAAGAKVTAVLAMQLACWALVVLGVVAVLRVVLGG